MKVGYWKSMKQFIHGWHNPNYLRYSYIVGYKSRKTPKSIRTFRARYSRYCIDKVFDKIAKGHTYKRDLRGVRDNGSRKYSKVVFCKYGPMIKSTLKPRITKKY